MSDRKLKATICSVLLLMGGVVVSACSDSRSHARAVVVLLDVSGTYVQQVEKARRIVDYLLSVLGPGDSLSVARIDSASFSEKDIIASTTFSDRPSLSNAEKRAFRKRIAEFAGNIRQSGHTDISGAVLQGLQYLDETGAGRRYLFVFSDLKEDLKKDHIRQWEWNFRDTEVVAVNVTKLESDNRDPREYLSRVAQWREKVEASGGRWQVINDLTHVQKVFD